MNMEYGPSDSSGTDDDLPPSHQNRSARGGLVSRSGSGRPVVGGHAYSRVQIDMENQIHQLEQEAYSSVLRAFKAQSDAITWEKEGLITELRKELRVSDDEHRDLLSRVNADEIILGIREWRKSGGLQSGFLNNAPLSHDAIPSPTVSASRKRQKTSQIVPPLPLGVPSPSFHSQAIGVAMQASSAAKRGVPGVRGKKPKLGQSFSAAFTPTGPSGRGQAVNRSSGAITTAHSVEAAQNDPLIGRKVMTRWPDDNNFYEAVINGYDAMKGLHLLTYDINTPNETLEWVNLEEISTEDIRWEGEDPYISHRSSRGGLGRGVKKSRGGIIPAGAGGRGFLKNQPKKDFQLSQNGGKNEIEILNTETLIKEVEMIFDATHLDPLEFEKAKKLLKEHEQSLLDAIARLADASDGESEDDEHHLSNGQPLERDSRSWRSHLNGNQHAAANYDNEMAVVVGSDDFDGGRTIS